MSLTNKRGNQTARGGLDMSQIPEEFVENTTR
jgi:hypothetical protein